MTIHGYQIVTWTQHWTIIDGCVYRDAVAIRLADGARRLIAVIEGEL
jgi:hypothetical protein